MNKKFVLYSLIVLMTLSLTLGVASAEDTANNADTLSLADNAPADNVAADVSGGDVYESDLSVEIKANETDNETFWDVVVTNNGPDPTYAYVYIDYTDNIAVSYCAPERGDYLVEFGVWDVGTVYSNESLTVYIEAPKWDDGPYVLNALAISEDYKSLDPYLGNNYDRKVFGNDPGDDYKAAEGAIMPISNLAIDVEVVKETDDAIYWSVIASNKGPESADTTLVAIDYSNNLEVTNYEADAGDYRVKRGLWDVGSISANESKQLLIETKKIGNGTYYLEALTIAEDSYNTNLGRNYDIEIVIDNPNNNTENNSDVHKVEAAKETLPATANPIALVLLAFLVIGVNVIKRKE